MNSSMLNRAQTELAPNPEKSQVYASAAIVERRKRILKETRKMIGEAGVQGFSVRELCVRSDVALRTLYNAFHSKERLIAIAIQESYDDVERNIDYRTSADTLEGIMDRLTFINTRNMSARNYTKAVASLYFAPDVGDDIWVALQHMVFRNLRQWLNRMAAEKHLQKGVELNELAMTLANLEYSVINDWAQGRIPDQEFVPRLIRSVLRMTVGTMTGEPQAQAQRYLDEIAATGKAPEFPPPIVRRPRKQTPRGKAPA
jgi:AcrR family transcriptional regulator